MVWRRINHHRTISAKAFVSVLFLGITECNINVVVKLAMELHITKRNIYVHNVILIDS